MYNLFVVLIIVASLLMIGIVLIQESKGGGLSSSFASYNQIGGVRKTTDFIEKATWTLAVAMVVISVVCAHVAPTAVGDTSVMEGVENPTANPNNVQGFGASQAPAAEVGQQAAPQAGNAATETPVAPAQPAK